jgi:hypothetical protein
MGRILSGRGNLTAAIEGHQVRTDELLSALDMTGTVHLFAAQLINQPVARNTMQLLGLPARDTIPLQSRWNRFHLEQGRIRLDEFAFTALESPCILTGTAGLDGSLDYRLQTTLSKALSDRLKLPASLRLDLPTQGLDQFDPVDLMKNEEGRADIFLEIRGDYLSPSVSLDMARLRPLLQKRFEERVAGKVTQELEDKLKEGLKGLFDRKR